MIHDAKTVDRFMAKVEQPAHGHACWFWKGAIFKGNGYGAFKSNGKTLLAHRVAWEIGNRAPFPPGMLATHSCDNKKCVNFDHIRPGTKSTNGKEAWDRGRMEKSRAATSGPRELCGRGHRLADTAHVRPNGTRYCLHCKQETQRKYEQKRKAE